MDQAGREDILLAVRRHLLRSGEDPRIPFIAGIISSSPEETTSGAQELVLSGDLVISGDHTLVLTEKGREAADAILRKHRILETFLQEMLGMDHQSAHSQACTIEHHTSDETINRLSSFIQIRPPCLEGGVALCCRPLTACRDGERVRIHAIRGGGRSGRLSDLGLIPGELLVVRKRLPETILVRVKDSDIAISDEIAETILVGDE